MVANIFQNYGLPAVIIGILAFGLTFIVKLPVKYFTAKITHAGWKKLVNKTILLIPIFLGIGLWFLYAYIFHIESQVQEICYAGLSSGIIAITTYEIFSGVIKGFKNPYADGEGKEIADAASDILLNKNLTVKQLEDKVKDYLTEGQKSEDGEVVAVDSNNLEQDEDAEIDIEEACYVLSERLGKPYEVIQKIVENIKKL